MTYILHYAPDNASLIIRTALELRGLPYRTQLVDRRSKEQMSPAYRALNPNGLIPVLETPQGPMFETGAILLWLADTHGGLGPTPESSARADFLKWLFFISNTIHPALRMMFYPAKYIADDHIAALRAGLADTLHQSFTTLDQAAAGNPALFAGASPTVLELYAAALLRWSAIYPAEHDKTWFSLANYPALQRICLRLETLPVTECLQITEGLGTHPFSDPQFPTPPIGSAT
ncbi:glutathione S-transferase family protein [Sulfitobacter pacificus]|uniref:glutathione S-transferase family protein n=1 Tax=Sulfitobacter pacificus TaxID=1499314 RepID=UPI003104DB31